MAGATTTGFCFRFSFALQVFLVGVELAAELGRRSNGFAFFEAEEYEHTVIQRSLELPETTRGFFNGLGGLCCFSGGRNFFTGRGFAGGFGRVVGAERDGVGGGCEQHQASSGKQGVESSHNVLVYEVLQVLAERKVQNNAVVVLLI